MKSFKRRGMLYKRKRQGKTDYKRRLGLLKAGQIRLVIRRSLHNITIQFVQFHPDGDTILSATSSKELQKKYNVKGSMKNTPAAYLVGLLAGKKALGLKVKEAIPDLGGRKPHTGGAVFAALRGVIDAGIPIPHEKVTDEGSVFPTQERIEGAHLTVKQDYKGLKEKLV